MLLFSDTSPDDSFRLLATGILDGLVTSAVPLFFICWLMEASRRPYCSLLLNSSSMSILCGLWSLGILLLLSLPRCRTVSGGEVAPRGCCVCVVLSGLPPLDCRRCEATGILEAAAVLLILQLCRRRRLRKG